MYLQKLSNLNKQLVCLFFVPWCYNNLNFYNWKIEFKTQGGFSFKVVIKDRLGYDLVDI